jgi:dihydrofolate reductase
MPTNAFSGKVLLDMAMSLDGFVSAPNNDSGGLYDWYFQEPRGPADRNPEIVADLIATTGAIIMGRRVYGQGNEEGYDGNPYRCRHFVLTHTPPAQPPKGDTDFTFVTDGIESALRQAKAAAGDRHVVVAGGAETAQQFLRAGLLEEIHLHIVPVALGAGLRLFENLAAPVKLEPIGLIEAPGVTHQYFRVLKES